MPTDEPLVRFTLNGQPASAVQGVSVAAALLANGVNHFRRSVTGQPRAPLCGMGICYECRVKVNGDANVKSCMQTLEAGIEVETDE